MIEAKTRLGECSLRNSCLDPTVLTGLLWVVSVAAIVLVASWLGVARGAPPPGADPSLAPWFQGLQQPGTGISCCSISDCRPVQDRVRNGGYEVKIGEEWIAVPPDKVLDRRDNPTGSPIACYTPSRGVMCFIRGIET